MAGKDEMSNFPYQAPRHKRHYHLHRTEDFVPQANFNSLTVHKWTFIPKLKIRPPYPDFAQISNMAAILL